MTDTTNIKTTTPRENIVITLVDDDSTWQAPLYATAETILKAARPAIVPGTDQFDPRQPMAIAALVNGALRELTFELEWDSALKPVLISDSDGLRIYRRALSLLLVVAAEELFPGRKITIDHSLPFGGYYCAIVDGEPFTDQELAQIKARMREIVEADERIVRMAVPLDEAIAYFEERGDDDKLRLMKNRTKDYLILYELRGYRDYFYGYMVPSTGYLTLFDLTHDGEGFILHYPRRRKPDRLIPAGDLPKLRAIFRESGRWLGLMGVPDIGAMNQAVRDGRILELILVTEALHEGRFADIADAIVARQPEVRVVLIAGPSSSGKTTSSKRLAIQLMAHGLKPYPLGLDNYFVDRDKTPRGPDGDYDFEHLHAVDLDRFNEHLLKLMNGEVVLLPEYNFHKGASELRHKVQLTPEHIIIVEGIHALNPELVRELPQESLFRLYISCLTQLNIDRHNRVPTTDVRLLRRMVRDAAYRGYSAQETLSRWRSVREGERKWIFPYQENADMMLNSAMVYELAVLKRLAEPLLLQVDRESPQHVEAKRLLAFLNWVEPLTDDSLVPRHSLLREFIGGSVLRDYVPGKIGK